MKVIPFALESGLPLLLLWLTEYNRSKSLEIPNPDLKRTLISHFLILESHTCDSSFWKLTTFLQYPREKPGEGILRCYSWKSQLTLQDKPKPQMLAMWVNHHGYSRPGKSSGDYSPSAPGDTTKPTNIKQPGKPPTKPKAQNTHHKIIDLSKKKSWCQLEYIINWMIVKTLYTSGYRAVIDIRGKLTDEYIC